ncbi:hydrolase [Polynucleobacter sp. QLW-P1DATA-2]|uniref:metal-dependent hydrolase n=1 Tax=unclassified Polynucleobacter TaxID=2640945 RepID=UPI0008F82362|nr:MULTISPECIES: metal-dependent hydrolase [unclassified Polynucleobacter]OIM97274.1 hydrolase [Polynucleobacter sp. QLW-P1DATA-2]OIN00078.1 hydrolase [Polynucleobacter sp. MWH-Tro8-2-5-gr]
MRNTSLKKWIAKALVLPVLLTASTFALAQTSAGTNAQNKTELLWFGQAGFRIKSPEGKMILIDPWITGGPKTPPQYKNDLAAIGPIDLLLVTHAHVDHLGDAPAVAKANNIKLYGPADMVTPLTTLGIIPAELGWRFNKTGSVTPLPGIKVTAVQAEHSSLLVWKNPATDKLESHPAGEPVGYIIELENGFKIWHMGDTGLFSDMKFISEHYKPDLVLIPIGGNFTMAPEDAAYALKTWVKPKMVIPMHYGSNPMTKGTLAEFQAAMKGSSIKIIPMTEGETVQF